MRSLRDAVRAREARLRETADDDCPLCRGTGKTHGWVAQGYTSYACPRCHPDEVR